MTDHLEQQLINELRSVLQPINETYKDFFHIQLLTLCDMKDLTCSECKDSETGQKCMRCVVGYQEVEKKEDSIPRIIDCCWNTTNIPCDHPECPKKQW